MSLVGEFDILATIRTWKPQVYDNIIFWYCDQPGYYLFFIKSGEETGDTIFITPSVCYTKKSNNSKLIINGVIYIDESISYPNKEGCCRFYTYDEFRIYPRENSYDFWITDKDGRDKYNLTHKGLTNERCIFDVNHYGIIYLI